MALRSLAIFCGLFGLVCMGIALSHIALGPKVIPGSVPVNAIMDSEDSFYATLFLGFGAAVIWCARDLPARAGLLRALMAVFFLGGIARLVSVLRVGPPSAFFQFLTALELLIPPLTWMWLRLALKRGGPMG